MSRGGPTIILLTLASMSAMPRAQAASLEVYGRLPRLEEVALSPDGTRVAFVRTAQDTRTVAVVSLTDRKVLGGLRVSDEKLQSIEWADNDHLMIITSATKTPIGFVGPSLELFMLQVFDLINHKSIEIPNETQFRFESQNLMNVLSSTRIMVRHVNGHTVLYVPGVTIAYDRAVQTLIRVDLQASAQSIARQGDETTREWLVDDNGEIFAQSDYFDKSQRWTLKIRQDGHLKEVLTRTESVDLPRILGYGPTPNTLLLQLYEDGQPIWRSLSLQDGSLGPPLAENKTLDEPIEDEETHRMIGGMYLGDEALYVFFDPAIQAKWNAIVKAFSGDRVQFVSYSSNFRKFVVLVDGPSDGLRYVLVDMETNQAEPIGDVYEGIKSPYEVRRITYKAADGMEIPAYLTLPRGREPKKLPLVVLAHGGPESRDTADFDYWPQSLADQGYAVLQTNFRGSSVDASFIQAGFGEWGRKMQTDLSDGVRYLAKEGIADPARVCIVGASYGGYAALAGVTIDPGVYRCAVAVAGISDLKRMLAWEADQVRYSDKDTVRYWNRFMGVSGPGDPKLDAISPIKHIDAVKVPVLLIHGKDDTVVPFEQSTVMFDALRSAKKDVQMVTLKHEDHWLSRGETRLQMLESSVEFLRAQNPPDP